jgi:hypothetical protein
MSYNHDAEGSVGAGFLFILAIIGVLVGLIAWWPIVSVVSGAVAVFIHWKYS